ncbi:MAG: cell envelope integrity protein CreD, partial [Bacteroidota bacterium]
MSQSPSTFDRINNWARRSVMLKLFTIGILILFLLIPTSMLDGLIYQRQNLRDSAQVEVASKWGLQQTIGGPIISVPYTYKTAISTDEDGKVSYSTNSGYAHFLPEELEIEGELLPEERYRGIFVVVLYNTKLNVKGKFGPFDAAALGVPETALRWEDASLNLGITDMTGVQSAIEVNIEADSSLSLGPGTVTGDVFSSGASTSLPLSGVDNTLNFSFELDLNGSSAFYFRPFAKRTAVSLVGTWPSPSFDGAFLPKKRSVENGNFTANWEVLQLNRNYPQQGTGSFTPKISDYRNSSIYVDEYSQNYDQEDRFGLRLLLPVDEYKKTYRSTNFAVLFIFITFLTFFFIEVLNRRRVHPVQYLLIGAAIIIFYILLLSI